MNEKLLGHWYPLILLLASSPALNVRICTKGASGSPNQEALETVGMVLALPGHSADLVGVTEAAVLATQMGQGSMQGAAQMMGASGALTLVGWAGVAESFVSAGLAMQEIVSSGNYCLKTFSFGKVLVCTASGALGAFANLHSGNVSGIVGSAVASAASVAMIPAEEVVKMWCSNKSANASETEHISRLEGDLETIADSRRRELMMPRLADHDIFKKRLIDMILTSDFSHLRPNAAEHQRIREAIDAYLDAYLDDRLRIYFSRTSPQALKQARELLERTITQHFKDFDFSEKAAKARCGMVWKVLDAFLQRGLSDLAKPRISMLP